jgi:tetratricopeptide (TPR) repeat protein
MEKLRMILDAKPGLLIVVVLGVFLCACAGSTKMMQEPAPAAESKSAAESIATSNTSTSENSASGDAADVNPSGGGINENKATKQGVVITPLVVPESGPPEKLSPSPSDQQGENQPQQDSTIASSKATSETQITPNISSKPTTLAMLTESKTVVADNLPREFTITVGKKDPSHPYYGVGHDIGFIVDGVQGEELVLTRGVKYTFLVNTNVQHDFYFTTSPIGRGVGTVTNGITGQFTYRGVVSFTPTASTPAVMYYECRNHQYMGGKIHIATAGEKVSIGGAPSISPAAPAERIVVTEAEVKQKISYAEMVINSSSPVKRVEASDIVPAKRLVAQAKEKLGNAHTSFDAGDTTGAMNSVDEALRLTSTAIHMVPDTTDQVNYKERYSTTLDQIHSFEKSYKKNVAKGIKPKSGKELDEAQYGSLLKEAESLASKEQYQNAMKPLVSANEMLTAALGALLESQTVVYDKNFATPQEEYEYELSRYSSYEELIPLAIEQRKPTEQVVSMMDVLAKRAKEIRNEGVALAAKGDHKQAILALQAATERLQRALRLAGVQ